VFLVAPLTLTAQQLPLLETLILSSDPVHPEAFEQVEIKLATPAYDASSAEISWFVDGKLVSKGIGTDSIRIRTKDVGQETLIEVFSEPTNGLPASKTFSITPVGLSLVWEALTSTPPFYKGKPLHTPGGDLRIVALPTFSQNGAPLSDQNLRYSWFIDNEIQSDQSGVGNNILAFKQRDLLFTTTVEVIVRSLDGQLQKKSRVSIPVAEPELRIYKRDPLLGILFHNARDTLTTTSDETTLKAEPYYFSEPEEMEYLWRIDGQTATSTEQLLLLGTSQDDPLQVDVSTKNSGRILQSATHMISLVRSAFTRNSDDLFGF